MFGVEFYPTPKKVIGKMLEPFLKPDKEAESYRRYRPRIISGMTLLDPGAGKGDILDYLNEMFDREEQPEMYCCEIDPNLKAILQVKGYRVIAEDFLQYNGDYLFDLIVMNPPFSNGDEHLLKAWDILEDGHIACLLNIETVENTYSERRQHLRKLIDHHGSYERLGPVFKDSEHPTDVEVALVRLHKKSHRKKLDFEFENLSKGKIEQLDEHTFKNQVATNDIIGNMIIQFNELKKYYVEYLKCRDALQFYSDGLVSQYARIMEIAEECLDKKNNSSYNNFCDAIKQQVWSVVLSRTKVQNLMTHNVRRNFHEFCKQQGYMDFTKENVASLVNMIFENRIQIMENAIVEVFDMFTRHHKENRYLIDGWKTNDKWKVNRRIILPRALRMSWDKPADRMRFGANYQLNYSTQSEYTDIDKVMCYLTGNNLNYITTINEALEYSFRQIGKVYKGPHTGTAESEFFRMKFYMKGTLHLEFKDEHLWDEFNMRACAGKQWLPENEMKEYQERKKREAQPKAAAEQPEPEPQVLMIEAPAEEVIEATADQSASTTEPDVSPETGQVSLALF